MEEPSVLDYLKSRLNPWGSTRLQMPEAPASDEPEEPDASLTDSRSIREEARPGATTRIGTTSLRLPWRSLSALLLALMAQYSLFPRPGREAMPGVLFLIFALGTLIWAVWKEELELAPPEPESAEATALTVNYSNLLTGTLLALAAFLSFGSLQFSVFNLSLLGLGLFFIVRGFWIKPRVPFAWATERLKRLRPPPWQLTVRSPALISLGVVALAAFFRFYRLGNVPPEMNSDHAEKFVDVLRVLSGQTLVFFSGNGGREALQFYLVAGLHRLTGMPLNFLILKLVTSTVGFLALPYLYLLGKELGGRRVGWLAFLFAGIAYWPNVVARVGLRLPFYMLFSAALFYYLVRGLRRSHRNDFIAAGIILGLGFYSYSASRILPLLVIAAVGLYVLHRRSSQRSYTGLVGLLVAALVSLVIFLPLLRFILAEPQGFFMRTLTRMGTWERSLDNPILLIFLNNAGRALAMFSWDAGVVWPISIPGYPALSLVSGGLFYIGVGLVLIRYARKRDWRDLFLLVSIPILLLPSMLALAFPDENPNLYRTGGAIVPVFLLIALALDSLMKAIEARLSAPWGRRLALVLAIFLLAINALQDYSLVFERYYQNYRLSAWNSSEMGEVARNFTGIYQNPNNVWVIGFPNWVDTRLVANNAGFPGRDFELKIENIPTTASLPGPKLFMLNPQDQEGLDALQQAYPVARLELYESKTPTKDFLIYTVLPETAE